MAELISQPALTALYFFKTIDFPFFKHFLEAFIHVHCITLLLPHPLPLSTKALLFRTVLGSQQS